MPERCRQCERYEKNLKELRERRTNLWRGGELTGGAAENLVADEQRITQELRVHQASSHSDAPQPNLEEEIRRRAYELYEARGREDGHDLEDWLQAEAEITAVTPKAAAALSFDPTEIQWGP